MRSVPSSWRSSWRKKCSITWSSGPGRPGCSWGSSSAAAGHRYLVLEAGSAPGTFFATFPRHRTLISINKTHTGWTDPELNLRMDWNSILADVTTTRLLFTNYSDLLLPGRRRLAPLPRRLRGEAPGPGPLRHPGDAHPPRPESALFVLTAGDAEFRARRLIVATGVTKPYVPQFPGVELTDQYADVSVDPDDFTDQRVLILGKGNSAFETADTLIETAARHPRRRPAAGEAGLAHPLRRPPARGTTTTSSTCTSSSCSTRSSTATCARSARTPTGYHVKFSFARADEVIKEIRYDRVIGCTGFRFDASMFDEDCRPSWSSTTASRRRPRTGSR